MPAQWSHDVCSTWGHPRGMLSWTDQGHMGQRWVQRGIAALWLCMPLRLARIQVWFTHTLSVHISFGPTAPAAGDHGHQVPEQDARHCEGHPGGQAAPFRWVDGWGQAMLPMGKGSRDGSGRRLAGASLRCLRCACMLSACSLAMAAGLNRGTHRHAALVSAQGNCSMCRPCRLRCSAGRGG